MYFKSKIKHLAIEKNMSLAKIAKETKLSKFFLYDLANGNLKLLRIESLKILKDFLGCKMSDLIYFPDDSNIVQYKVAGKQEIYGNSEDL